METIPLTLPEYGLLLLVSTLAGAINAVAGGGTFFTFPALIWLGIPPIIANATNKMGLWVGTLGSIKGYVPHIHEIKSHLPLTIALNLAGGLIGTLLLLWIDADQFRSTIPWLLGLATASFAFGSTIRRLTHRDATTNSLSHRLIGHTLHLLIGIYAGFFGAGLGIFLLALYQWMGMQHIHQMNGLKVVAAAVSHSASAAVLVFSSLVMWPVALIMIIGAGIGGYGSALLAQYVPTQTLRYGIIAYGTMVTISFFM